MRARGLAGRAWVVGLALFASPPAAAQGTDAADGTSDAGSDGSLTTDASTSVGALEAELAQALPSPRAERSGAVPMTEPIAPVPPGEPAWAVSAAVRGGLADAFYGKAVVELAARRGFGWWSLEAFGGPAVSWEGPALDLCRQAGTCTTPSGQQLGAAPGRLTWLAGAGPVARFGLGKISFAGLPATRFGFEAGVAPMAVGYRIDVGDARYETAPGGRFSLGLGFDVSETLAIRAEWQGIGYLPTLRGDMSFETQMLAGVALAWRPGVAP